MRPILFIFRCFFRAKVISLCLLKLEEAAVRPTHLLVPLALTSQSSTVDPGLGWMEFLPPVAMERNHPGMEVLEELLILMFRQLVLSEALLEEELMLTESR